MVNSFAKYGFPYFLQIFINLFFPPYSLRIRKSALLCYKCNISMNLKLENSVYFLQLVTIKFMFYLKVVI